MRLLHPDGRALGATVVPGSGRRWVVVGGAVAVPHRFYLSFAEWVARRLGANVLCFDYEGVGASRREDLRACRADLRSWADDLALAIGHAAARGPTVVVGHSFGGQAFGITPAHRQTVGLYAFGSGAGWHGWMPAAERWRLRAFWYALGPTATRAAGYAPLRALGIGEDVPAGVFRDWRRWCLRPRYFFDDPEADFTVEYARVDAPVVGVSATDDLWAPPLSVEVLTRHYPRGEVRVVRPDDVGVPIGHLGYLRPGREALWEGFAAWAEARFSDYQSRSQM